MDTTFILFLLTLKISAGKFEAPIPMGHGKELGKHKISDGHVEQLYKIPSPPVFWQKFASVRKPVVFKGAAKNFPAFKLWTDEFLIDNFGNLEVKLESKKEKDKTPIGEKGLGRDTIKSYLNNYRTKDSYVVSQLPHIMARDINVLPCLACGTFLERIMEANLWLSSGGTSSLLHRDADNAINCLLNGTKDWILIDPIHEDKIPIAEGDTGYGGFAVLDVNSVNLIKYSDFQLVPWQYANLTAGDCLFLPYDELSDVKFPAGIYAVALFFRAANTRRVAKEFSSQLYPTETGYWHQVRSYGSKNMAVSLLFSRLKHFDPTGCNRTEYTSFSLADADVIWTYPGHGSQTLGNGDPYEIRDVLVEVARDLEDRHETFDNPDVLFSWFNEVDLLGEESQVKQIAELVYESLSTFTNGKITSESLMKLSIDQLKSLAILMDNDPANTDEYEHAVFQPGEIEEVVKNVLRENNGAFSLPILKTAYEAMGGSERIASDLFLEMDLNQDGSVNNDEISKTLDSILAKFEKEMQHDPSSDYYKDELEKDRKMMADIKRQLPDEL